MVTRITVFTVALFLMNKMTTPEETEKKSIFWDRVIGSRKIIDALELIAAILLFAALLGTGFMLVNSMPDIFVNLFAFVGAFLLLKIIMERID